MRYNVDCFNSAKYRDKETIAAFSDGDIMNKRSWQT